MSTMSILTGSHNKSEVYSGFKSELGEIKEIVDEKLLRQFGESLHYETDEEEKYDAIVGEDFLLGSRLPHKEQLGPLLPLKKQVEKDQVHMKEVSIFTTPRSLHFYHSSIAATPTIAHVRILVKEGSSR